MPCRGFCRRGALLAFTASGERPSVTCETGASKRSGDGDVGVSNNQGPIYIYICIYICVCKCICIQI